MISALYIHSKYHSSVFKGVGYALASTVQSSFADSDTNADTTVLD